MPFCSQTFVVWLKISEGNEWVLRVIYAFAVHKVSARLKIVDEIRDLLKRWLEIRVAFAGDCSRSLERLLLQIFFSDAKEMLESLWLFVSRKIPPWICCLHHQCCVSRMYLTKPWNSRLICRMQQIWHISSFCET